ncbi:unnamed protein product [Heligmosomoides polygyrus]|uniref:Myosin_tail_1 domain-containing protein n=1 Tax=Heligmosomoides polygyrus TaxID=6339 RepID=A0A183GRB7_HELPZ|nr:unnamed protein product [Heligmosomoides polygyrus]
MERELRSIEERWMERTRSTINERDALLQKLQQLEEQVDSLRADLNRAVAYRLEVEESRNRMKNQLESVQRDYEETMAERSSVLEENTRMGEERDRLKQTVHALSRTLNELRGRTVSVVIASCIQKNVFHGVVLVCGHRRPRKKRTGEQESA